MDRDVDRPDEETGLFRRKAVRSAGLRLFGGVVAVVPPSAVTGIGIGAVAVLLLVIVAVTVEIPMRAQAVGVLMPPGGLIDILAPEAGQVSAVHVADDQPVAGGTLLLEIAATGTTVAGTSRSALQLHSLQAERRLIANIHEQRLALAADREAGLRQQLEVVEKRQRISESQLAANADEQRTLATVLERLQALAHKGHVAGNDVDRERAALYRVRAAGGEIEQRRAALVTERERLQNAIRGEGNQVALLAAEFALQNERLERDIRLASSHAVQGVQAPESATVVRLLAAPGMVVRRGQLLARLARGSGRLEAWLYLSNSSARMLRSGQPVELQLDAWPQSVFGSWTAVVFAVSSIALSPAEVPAPLMVAGPVFEVRARLERQTARALDADWPIPPGTAFSANIIQRRLRLYEWLFRSLRGRNPRV